MQRQYRWLGLFQQCCTGAMLLFCLPSLAAEVGFSGILPGVTLLHKPVVSVAESRYLNVVRQSTDFSCGAASLATILKYAYGKDVDEKAVLKGLQQVSDPNIVKRKGFSLLDLKRYVESLGMSAKGYRVTPEHLRGLKVPVIVMLDLDGYKHFVVLKRLVGQQTFLADPALGNKIMGLSEFIHSWEGQIIFAVVGEGYQAQNSLLQVSRPPNAKHWLLANGTITDSQLLDFGFEHATLF